MRRTTGLGLLAVATCLALALAPVAAFAETRVVTDEWGNEWTVTDELDREGDSTTEEGLFTIVIPEGDVWDIDKLTKDQLHAALGGGMPDSAYADYPESVVGKGTTCEVYRLYNPYTGEHLYTIDAAEKDHLATVGWTVEGATVEWMEKNPESIGMVCKMSVASPIYPAVYRLYNPLVPGGDHHYTTDVHEYETLQTVGWRGEGAIFNSAPMAVMPLYRLYNPNAEVGAHHYTTDRAERDALVELGWAYEGIGWYAWGFAEGVG